MDKEDAGQSTDVVNDTSNERPAFNLRFRVYKGVLMVDNEAEDIEVMDTRPDDIWVCSYPRSGTTLTQEMTYLIQTLDFQTALNVNLDDRFPMIDIKDDRFPFYRGVKHVEQMASPRMVKCHLPYSMLPQQLREGKGRIICIARNPKDVASSYCRITQWLDVMAAENTEGKAFLKNFVDGTGPCDPWTDHVLSYWNGQKDPCSMLFLRYEDVVKDLKQTCRKIADFLGRTLSDDDVDRICRHCHVDNMRSNDQVNMAYWRNYKHINDDQPSRFINKGKPGTWRETLSKDEAQQVDQLLTKLQGTGLEFSDD